MSVPQDCYTDEHGCVIPAGDVALYTFLAEFPFDAEDEADHDPYEWDSWVDEFRWELGPEPEPYEPTDEDLADYLTWSAGLDRGPTDEDLEDAYRQSVWQDLLDRERRLSDDDLAAAGLPVG